MVGRGSRNNQKEVAARNGASFGCGMQYLKTAEAPDVAFPHASRSQVRVGVVGAVGCASRGSASDLALHMERSIKIGPLLTGLGRSGASPYQLLLLPSRFLC